MRVYHYRVAPAECPGEAVAAAGRGGLLGSTLVERLPDCAAAIYSEYSHCHLHSLQRLLLHLLRLPRLLRLLHLHLLGLVRLLPSLPSLPLLAAVTGLR